jgi:lysozyme family protein
MLPKDSFSKIIKQVLKNEGGYVNDPDDLGGETKYGITKRRYPDLDIKNLTKEEAVELYKRDFWIPLKMDSRFSDLKLAYQFFDFAVNAGIKNAEKVLTEAKERKLKEMDSLLNLFIDCRRNYYIRIAEYRNNKKFLKGWLNRVNTSVA